MKTIDLMKINTIEAEIDYPKILEKYGQKSVDILRSPSVSPRSNRANRKTPYYLGWELKHTKTMHGERVTVWNRTNWQLTHLLENGHFITNKKNGIGWAKPNKHIYKTYLKVRPQFMRAIGQVDVEIEFK